MHACSHLTQEKSCSWALTCSLLIGSRGGGVEKENNNTTALTLSDGDNTNQNLSTLSVGNKANQNPTTLSGQDDSNQNLPTRKLMVPGAAHFTIPSVIGDAAKRVDFEDEAIKHHGQKADNAEVPIRLWDSIYFHSVPKATQESLPSNWRAFMQGMQELALRYWRRKVC